MTNHPRIEAITSQVDESFVAEIGVDHGYILKTLLESGKCQKAIATDISGKCLSKAKNNLKSFYGKVTYFEGDGLKPILEAISPQKNEISVPKQIIIAGMGGREIKQILMQDTQKNFSKFVLSPQKNVSELRRFLVKNNFFISSDFLVKDGKMFYNVLKVEKNSKKQSLSEMQIFFGKTNLENPSKDFLEYVKTEKQKCKDILHIKQVSLLEKKLKMLEKIDIGEKYV